MIDCHCHILPGVDDGAKTQIMSFAMARCALAAGTDAMVCTPHHLNGAFENDRLAVLDALAELREAFLSNNVQLALYPGGELHLTPELPSLLAVDQAITYNDQGRAALVELPKQALPLGVESILGQILQLGITPIIAHPERNTVLAAETERVAEWVNFGCKLQLTAQSCSGEFGKRIQSVCRLWCERGLAHIVASDAHRPTGRTPDMRAGLRALTEWVGAKNAEILTDTNPRRLIEGQDLGEIPPTISDAEGHSSRSWFSWLRR